MVKLMRVGRFCRNHVFWVTCGVFALYMCFCGDYSLVNIMSLESQEDELRDEIEEYREMTEDFQQRIDEVSVDNEKLERYAREKMHMHRQNEDLYLLDD